MSFKGLADQINGETSLTPPSVSPPSLPKIAPEQAAQRAAMLFGCFRRADAVDPEIYAASVAAILSEYDEETVAYVTDPRTGIARRSNFLPTVAEIDGACRERAALTRQWAWMLNHGWKYQEGQWIKPGAA